MACAVLQPIDESGLKENQKYRIIKKFCPKEKDHSFIVCNSKFVEIEWPRVVLWSDSGGLKMKPGTYYDYSGKPDRKPDVFVNHWDVCLSSESCVKVLNKRGISVHF